MTPEYSQGVCEDGAVLLCDGQRMTVDAVVAKLNELEKDKARLDFFDLNRSEDWPYIEVYVDAYGVNVEYYGDDDSGQAFKEVRQAIDNARSE